MRTLATSSRISGSVTLSGDPISSLIPLCQLALKVRGVSFWSVIDVGAGCRIATALLSRSTAGKARAGGLSVRFAILGRNRTTQGVGRQVSDNEPIEAPGAVLISADPTGQSDARYERICDLTEEDYQRYRDTYKTLYEVLFANTFAYFRGSAKVFASIWADANRAFAAREIRPTQNPDGMVLWFTQLRSVALTLCLSLCYHQQQTYQEICEKHGTDSDAHNAAKKVFGELYDNYRGYRYMYALRNVMIHDAMDAIALKVTASLDKSGQTVAVWDLQMDRKVMSQSKKISAEKKAEFASLTENPSLPELFAQIAKPMADANVKLLTILHPDLTDVCRNAVEFDELFGGRPGTRALAHSESPELKAGMRIGCSSWPNELIEFARKYQQGQEIRR